MRLDRKPFRPTPCHLSLLHLSLLGQQHILLEVYIYTCISEVRILLIYIRNEFSIHMQSGICTYTYSECTCTCLRTSYTVQYVCMWTLHYFSLCQATYGVPPPGAVGDEGFVTSPLKDSPLSPQDTHTFGPHPPTAQVCIYMYVYLL